MGSEIKHDLVNYIWHMQQYGCCVGYQSVLSITLSYEYVWGISWDLKRDSHLCSALFLLWIVIWEGNGFDMERLVSLAHPITHSSSSSCLWNEQSCLWYAVIPILRCEIHAEGWFQEEGFSVNQCGLTTLIWMTSNVVLNLLRHCLIVLQKWHSMWDYSYWGIVKLIFISDIQCGS